MGTLIRLLDFFSRWRVRWTRGSIYLAIPLTLFNSISLALLWLPYLREYGIPTWTIYVGAPIGFLIISLTLGYIDDKHELWKREVTQSNVVANPWLPPMLKSYDQIDEIHKVLCKKDEPE